MTGPLEAALMKAAQATADNQRSRHPQHHWMPVVRPASLHGDGLAVGARREQAGPVEHDTNPVPDGDPLAAARPGDDHGLEEAA